MHTVLSPIVDYSLNFELLQCQYNCWLFKTVTGTVNSSRVSGCSPNVACSTLTCQTPCCNMAILPFYCRLVPMNGPSHGPPSWQACGRTRGFGPQSYPSWRRSILPTFWNRLLGAS